ncbi:hydantoinase B/oxoprolinase family protein [Paracoccus versutus]|uniref:N-methylhydantoinase B n=1 Tax=Paracoccus versutus TaxID=34007 RepID=A0A3D9XUM4_PARVE|nr:hydantoinase B/oxoprolinase family protein [Paracoccus versutus]REF73421.1 N-methylhydantoinase B [Paracoccus versutus]WGR54560.1 hydantoinase B/oxoprolinase family protein [Paracoccus versutus]
MLDTRKIDLDPVTFEVLKNSFINSVDQMGEQILRTCYSFVVYNRDFSCSLHDAEGNLVAQGSEDCAVHVGTMHNTCKAVIRDFEGDIHEGDVFIINDPYEGGTHFCDFRLCRPIFSDGKLIAWSQANGHWQDVGGGVPGSLDTGARDMFREGVRVPPTRVVDKGVWRKDVANLIAKMTRDPDSIIGDMVAQTEATLVCQREILRLVEKYGRDTVEDGIQEVQNHTERAMRLRLREIPDGEWEVTEYFDKDPGNPGDKMLPVKIKMTKKGDQVTYDFTGTHPQIRSIYNASFGGSFSGLVAGMKTFFPDLPINHGFYRVMDVIAPKGTMINVQWPGPSQAYLMAFEKVMNATYELWSMVLKERAMSCVFNIEFLLVGGTDKRFDNNPFFMFYDWLPGGWGGRNGKDGAGMGPSSFGTGLRSQPIEGQERFIPMVVNEFEIQTDSGGPGKWRGGVGAVKSHTFTQLDDTVLSYICDRERSVAWGSEGGLPATPMGIAVTRKGASEPTWLGVGFSGEHLYEGDYITRPTGGGGGYGDPLERDPQAVLEDVIDDYVSLERARKDYGVIIEAIDPEVLEFRLDLDATERERATQRETRAARARMDPEMVAGMFRAGEIDQFDCVRHYATILDWGTGALLPDTTRDFRALYERRSIAHWKD